MGTLKTDHKPTSESVGKGRGGVTQEGGEMFSMKSGKEKGNVCFNLKKVRQELPDLSGSQELINKRGKNKKRDGIQGGVGEQTNGRSSQSSMVTRKGGGENFKKGKN